MDPQPIASEEGLPASIAGTEGATTTAAFLSRDVPETVEVQDAALPGLESMPDGTALIRAQ